MNKMTCVCIALIAASSFSAGVLRGQTQDYPKPFQPPVFHTEANGSTYYQPMQLHTGIIQVIESKQTLSTYSPLVEYDVSHDEKGRLMGCYVVLQTDPQPKYRPEPGGESSSPLSDMAIYTDINGDSVLDTMVQNGPEGVRSYILYNNAWVRVRTFMSKFAAGVLEYSLDGKTKYVFMGSKWQIAA